MALASKTQKTVSEELSSPAATSEATAVGNVANAQNSGVSSEVAEEIAQDVETSAASISSEVVTEVTEKALDGQEIIEDTDVLKEESLIPEEVIKPETPPKVEPQVSENEKGGEVAALGVVTVHKEVKASTPAKPLASSKATDELPQTSSVIQNYLLALDFALVTLTAGIWKRRKVLKTNKFKFSHPFL